MLAPRFQGRHLFFDASPGLASPLDSSAPRMVSICDLGAQGTGLCKFCLRTALPRGWGGGRHPRELQITSGEDSPKWNKFLNSHYLTSWRGRRPPLTRSREEAAVSASHRFPGRFPASQARAAPPAPEHRAEGRRGSRGRPGPRECAGARGPPESSRRWQFLFAPLQRPRPVSHSLSPPSLSSLSVPSAPTPGGE